MQIKKKKEFGDSLFGMQNVTKDSNYIKKKKILTIFKCDETTSQKGIGVGKVLILLSK